jgi:MATE family multidrug resistance protein
MKRMIRLSAPVALMYLGLMLMGFVDLLVVGRLGANEVGGLGVGNSIFSWIMVIGVGMLTGMDYPASHAIGEKNPSKAYRIFVQAFYLAILMSIPLTLLALGLARNLHLFGFNAEVLPYATQYLWITGFSLVFVLGFNACRGYLQAQGITLPMLWVLILGNIFNLIMNVGLVYGKWGLPEWGFEGSAWATVSARLFTFIFAAASVVYYDRKAQHYLKNLRLKWEWELMRPVIQLGTPSSVHMLLEVGVFSLATALSAHFTAQALAAHQIVLTTASLTFMVTLGVASATGVLVGQAMGAKDYHLAKRNGWQGISLGAGFMILSATVLLLFPEPILRLYTPDIEVIAVAKELLLLAAFFQLADGVQSVVTGALRGIGNTQIAAVINLVGHWFIGLPIGLYLGFTREMGVRGIWMGLTTGLVVVAGSLLIAWRNKSRHLGPDARLSRSATA